MVASLVTVDPPVTGTFHTGAAVVTLDARWSMRRVSLAVVDGVCEAEQHGPPATCTGLWRLRGFWWRPCRDYAVRARFVWRAGGAAVVGVLGPSSWFSFGV